MLRDKPEFNEEFQVKKNIIKRDIMQWDDED